MNDEQLPMAELVQRTKAAYGLTWKDMGEQLGRSDRMMRKIARGETSGESFRQSMTELYQQGRVQTLTPRRRSTRTNALVRVRAKKGSEEKSFIPADTRGKPVPSAKRTNYDHKVTNLPGGNKHTRTDLPKTRNSAGRKKGWEAIDNHLLSTTKGQARGDKRIKLAVTVEDAQGQRRQYQIGSKSGYFASDVRKDIRSDHGGSIEGWFTQELEAVYPDTGTYTVVAVETNTFQASRSKAVRKQEDAAGTRRNRWRR